MGKITVCKIFSFSAAHFLPDYKGLCKNLHGHNWKLEIGITGPVNVETGFVMDFKKIKEIINDRIISVIDHKLLNEIKENSFPSANPTAENMLFWLVFIIKDHLRPVKNNLDFIRLWETDTSFAEWRNE